MTKLEEVALALEQSFKDRVARSAGMPFYETKVELPQRSVWMEYARASVESLKNAQAVDISDIHIDVHDQTYLYDFQIDRAFNAMIDAILNEEQK